MSFRGLSPSHSMRPGQHCWQQSGLLCSSAGVDNLHFDASTEGTRDLTGAPLSRVAL